MNAYSFFVVAALALGAARPVGSATRWQVAEDTYAIKFDTRGASGTIRGLRGTIAFDALVEPPRPSP